MIAGQDPGSLGSGFGRGLNLCCYREGGVQGVIDDVRAEGVNATS